MNRQTFNVGFAVLVNGYPGQAEKISAQTQEVYWTMLKDIPGGLWEITVKECLQCGGEFFPSISYIRTTALKIADFLPLTPARALAIVRQADVEEPVYRRDGSLAYIERYWKWPSDIKTIHLNLILKTLEKTGDPVNRRGDRIFAWDNQFQEIYEGIVIEYKAAAQKSLESFVFKADYLLPPSS